VDATGVAAGVGVGVATAKTPMGEATPKAKTTKTKRTISFRMEWVLPKVSILYHPGHKISNRESC
jgi:hypothetical protein